MVDIFVGVALLFAAGLWGACWRYTSGRIKEAERLGALGWRRVGFSFILGPIMAPPPPRRPDATVEREAQLQRLLADTKLDWRLVGVEKRPKPVLPEMIRTTPRMAAPEHVEFETLHYWQATVGAVTTNGRPPD
jgi:hypothetical protein